MHETKDVTDFFSQIGSVLSKRKERKKTLEEFGDTQGGRQGSSGEDDLIAIIPTAL